MPVKSAKQWGLMGAARSGKVPGIPPSVAEEMMDVTPVRKRRRFAKTQARKRKQARRKSKVKGQVPRYRTLGERMVED